MRKDTSRPAGKQQQICARGAAPHQLIGKPSATAQSALERPFQGKWKYALRILQHFKQQLNDEHFARRSLLTLGLRLSLRLSWENFNNNEFFKQGAECQQ